MTDTLAAGAAELSRTLRRLPEALDTQLHRQGAALAEPIAARAKQLLAGPYKRVLRPAIKPVVVAGVPTVTVAGTRPVVSGGATVDDLARGVEYGGGRRPHTRQFTRHPYLGPATEQAAGDVADRLGDLIDDLLAG